MKLRICVSVLLLSVLSVLAIGHVVRGTDTVTPTAGPGRVAALVEASVTAPRAQAPVVVEGALSSNSRGWSRASSRVAGTSATTLPTDLLDAYDLAVAASPVACHLSVSLLAAIGQVESGNLADRSVNAYHRAVPAVLGPVLDGHGLKAIRDTDQGMWDDDAQWDRALGPLQFLPATWRVVGLDLDGDGVRDPQNVYDAAGAAMVYLCAGGRDLGSTAGLRQAVLAYNHSVGYLAQVLRWKAVFDGADLSGTQSQLAAGLWATPEIAAEPLPAADVASRTPSRPTTARPLLPTAPTAVPTPAALGAAALPSASPGTPSAPVRPATTAPPTATEPSPAVPSSAVPSSSAASSPSVIPSSSATPDPACPPPSPTATSTATAEPAEPGEPEISPQPVPEGCPTVTPEAEPHLQPGAPPSAPPSAAASASPAP
jgi:hypothetical protein